MSHELQSRDSNEDSNDWSKTDSPVRRCKRMTCRRRFEQHAKDLFFCPQCRAEILRNEQSNGHRGKEAAAAEADYFDKLFEEERTMYDYQIIDEIGRTVWAGDWIRKAIAETKPRGL